MNAPSESTKDPYLKVPERTLYDACHSLGRDDNGRACPSCPVRDVCEAQEARRRLNPEGGARAAKETQGRDQVLI